MAGVFDYRGAAIQRLDANGNVFITVYNNSGGTLTQGKPYVIVNQVISGKVEAVAIAPATNTNPVNLIGLPVADIPDASYGEVQVEGIFGSVANGVGAITSGTVAANDNLQVINAGVSLIDEGTDGGALETVDVCAVAVANVTTNRWVVRLLGKRSGIAAT
jgi:hypothetical protein